MRSRRYKQWKLQLVNPQIQILDFRFFYSCALFTKMLHIAPHNWLIVASWLGSLDIALLTLSLPRGLPLTSKIIWEKLKKKYSQLFCAAETKEKHWPNCVTWLLFRHYHYADIIIIYILSMLWFNLTLGTTCHALLPWSRKTL